MNKIQIFVFLLLSCYSSASLLEGKINFSAEAELVERMKREMEKSLERAYSLTDRAGTDHKCTNCFDDIQLIFGEEHIFVFMSFSVPDEVWISLSKEMEKRGASFVIRGLPKNSFAELSQKIFSLKEKGVNVPIQVDPEKFKKYEIQDVPAFVYAKANKFDKVTGNISLKYALDRIKLKGDN